LIRPGVEDVGAEREVDAAGGRAGVGDDRHAVGEVRVALGRLDVESAGDDDRHRRGRYPTGWLWSRWTLSSPSAAGRRRERIELAQVGVAWSR
jgi:hypothetical protein